MSELKPPRRRRLGVRRKHIDEKRRIIVTPGIAAPRQMYHVAIPIGFEMQMRSASIRSSDFEDMIPESIHLVGINASEDAK